MGFVRNLEIYLNLSFPALQLKTKPGTFALDQAPLIIVLWQQYDESATLLREFWMTHKNMPAHLSFLEI